MLFGLLAIFGWCAGALWIGRTGGWFAATLGAVVFTLSLTSLGEWLVHGVLYHGRLPAFAAIKRIHHHGHHFALFPPTHYIQAGDYEFMRVRAPLTPFRMSDGPLDNAITKWGQVALHFVVGIPLILVPAFAVTGAGVFFFGSLATLAVASWLLAHVHGAIHTPKDRWIERRSWFRWLDRHHYIHHVDLGANINFMFPLCDVLFGTQKAALTEIEALQFPSYEQARTLPPSLTPGMVATRAGRD